MAVKADIVEAGMRLLARREHSRLELRRKLIQKGYFESDIKPVLDELVNNNYLSDERFAECYVRYRVLAGMGWQRIEHELRNKGVSPELIEQAKTVNEDVNWNVLLNATWQRKFGIIPTEQKEKARQMRFLQQRGFAMNDILRLWESARIEVEAIDESQ